MSDFVEIKGGVSLCGQVEIGGAKNAALPMLMAALLTDEQCTFKNVPVLQDVEYTISLLQHFGAEVDSTGNTIRVQIPKLQAYEASYSLVKALRASFWVLGPVLAREGKARVAFPGGDAIGTRPIDLHLRGLEQMGADIKFKHGVVFASARNGLRPAEIDLRFPSVGATHQLMMAAALVPGTSVIKGAAREPEVLALAEMISSMGAKVEGAGSETITVSGQKELGGTEVTLIGDRIEAGTYILAALATGGSAEVCGFDPQHLGAFLDLIVQLGASIEHRENGLFVQAPEKLSAVEVATEPFPGLATDLQAPLMSALCLAGGTSKIEENVFEGRFAHVSELMRMGAQIEIQERAATVHGVSRLSAAPVEGYDIRGAAALVVAALAADGTSKIYEPHHLARGYERLAYKLSGLGARVALKPEELEDALAIGC